MRSLSPKISPKNLDGTVEFVVMGFQPFYTWFVEMNECWVYVFLEDGAI